MTKIDTWRSGLAVFGSHSITKSQLSVRTSLTHPLQIATIPVGEKGGRIGITLCPGKVDDTSAGGAWERDLQADVASLRDWGASSVLTLLEAHEFDLLKVRGLPEAVRDAGLIWHHSPIPDVSVPGPSFEAAWRTIGPRLVAQLCQGQSVVVHCRGGLGRAGMIAAVLVNIMGEEPSRAIERVRAVRPGAIETLQQENHVLRHNHFI
ncbi:cyclin-dependent kinase inhibitor 3 family protein [Methylobacterium sp. 391_Methyba4]|uniref:cyclin-dependent kinase inhibitor 3 family protein n=1 Tax=Methylobacterium sp. 391_Methyba4 TaxID=3038924 RepID=UPI00241DC576|nr:cyclin-dependent kinase inhibitor 3 family protein [Methylobacterium sp. 391_Methyba4]WFS09556.1 cyclin-dependent kinase inhibitor 3 family protein [Methylobacterium sp. 391_Methyba4]